MLSVEKVPELLAQIPKGAFPIVRLSLIHAPRRFSCLAILDSGAGCCSFPQLFLTELGISPIGLPADQALGVGGIGTRLFHNITIEMPGFTPFQIYAGFALPPMLEEIPPYRETTLANSISSSVFAYPHVASIAFVRPKAPCSIVDATN